MFKIATWNVNSLNVRLEQVVQWLEQNQPDILALQELKIPLEKLPFDIFKNQGYYIIANAQKTYNGVAILSKIEPLSVQKDLPNYADEQKRVIAATYNNLRVINFYVPNGESTESLKYQYKLAWLETATKYLEEELAQWQNVIVLGDFNIAPHDHDVYDPIKWQGQVLCSPLERQFFQSWLKLGYHDAFRLFPQDSNSFSWWDYRMAAFRRNLGLRIDHVLVSTALQKDCRACYIDKAPRKLERPSDHTPVVLELERN